MTPNELLRPVRALAESIYEQVEIDGQPNACLDRASIAVLAAELNGQRAIVQAGTAYWPRATLPSGEIEQYGYEWTDSEEMWDLCRREQLPEIHVWAAFPGHGFAVDPSSGHFPKNCIKAGRPWEAPTPPDWYVMTVGAEHPAGVVYKANAQATLLAALLMQHQLGKLLELNIKLREHLSQESNRAYRRKVLRRIGTAGCPIRYPDMALVRTIRHPAHLAARRPHFARAS